MTEIERAIERISFIKQVCAKWVERAYEIALAALREQADFVRCKHCEYWQNNNGGYPNEECRWGHDETPDADDFCSFGKLLEVEHD